MAEAEAGASFRLDEKVGEDRKGEHENN